MDDVAEKARRNLMVISTGILAVWALGIPLDGRLVGAVDLSAVDPWRAWSAAICVLVYFAMRYRLSPSISDKLKSWKLRRRDLLHTWSTETLNLQVSKDHFRSASPDLKIHWPYVPDDDVYVALKRAPIYRGRGGYFEFCWDISRKPRYFGEDAESPNEAREYPTDPIQVHFQFDWRFFLSMHWEAFKSAYRPSWELLEFSVPWFLAFWALVVCLWRLGASLYYSFPFVRQLLPA
ncbi:hypothetical protein KAF81_33375 [Pseudomonas aeruginosa]|uniref:hypothetical protein n=1 Tax=Pseudomonas aeruginosa TaxID=287 RepID=UPI001B36354B|nr:hypothetical protein [Pseudomonas aeruginosa]MBP8322535.1 hypothetical protein [Pseudomonas aeruginosa]